MNADERRLELNQVTEMIIGCAFKVGNTLGVGFLERVYENALVHELRKVGLQVEQQKPLQVWYDGIVVGNYQSSEISNPINPISVHQRSSAFALIKNMRAFSSSRSHLHNA